VTVLVNNSGAEVLIDKWGWVPMRVVPLTLRTVAAFKRPFVLEGLSVVSALLEVRAFRGEWTDVSFLLAQTNEVGEVEVAEPTGPVWKYECDSNVLDPADGCTWEFPTAREVPWYDPRRPSVWAYLPQLEVFIKYETFMTAKSLAETKLL
jgi:hypothetical protein